MPRFASFDQRRYRTLSAREGYSRWAATYEDTIKHDMDIWLLGELQTVCWDKIERCADLGCGTGRTAAWLASNGVRTIDGIDATRQMLERARARDVFASLNLADVSDTRGSLRKHQKLIAVSVINNASPKVTMGNAIGLVDPQQEERAPAARSNRSGAPANPSSSR